MRIKLRTRVFLNFILVIGIFGVLGALLGAWIINRTTLDEAQRRVSLDLRSGWSVLDNELERLELFVSVLGTGNRVSQAFTSPGSGAARAALEAIRLKCGFDILSLTDFQGRVIMRTLSPYRTGDYQSNDPFVSRALHGSTVSGFSILNPARLQAEGGDLEERSFVAFVSTPKAKLRAKNSESSGMALMSAAPVYDDDHRLIGTIYAGQLLNRNHALVDRIRSIVFEDKKYQGRHLGTVTIFQWDARIATNVTLLNGNRATGTRVSEDVYDKVLENNLNWYDRAFVVNDWYLSAYDPIPDIEGKVIGIFYVGVLAKKYDDLKLSLWKLYGLISLGVAVVVMAVGLIFSRRLTGSLSRLADASARISEGELDLNVPEPAINDEVLDLTRSFNVMANSLRDREDRLRATNGQLESANASLQKLNADYLDMLGFVSHELKNTLGVIYTSARTLDKGLAGPLSDTQNILVRNISRNINSAVIMTRNYLDLARIEKSELIPEPRPIDLIKEVIEPILHEFRQAAEEKGMTIERDPVESMPLSADPALLQVVVKNLIDNALKYGRPESIIRISVSVQTGLIRIEVWNEGEGLSQLQLDRIFDKFVKFNQEDQPARSTGLGLFITREIIRKHGGSIRAESEPGSWIKFVIDLPENAVAQTT